MSLFYKQEQKPTKCKENVWHSVGNWGDFRQCTRNPVKDGFCRQHHPDEVKSRQAVVEARYKAKIDLAERRTLRRAISTLRARGWTITPPPGLHAGDTYGDL